MRIMKLFPIHTPLIKEGDDLATILSQEMDFEEDDILVVSSKVVATTEGAAIDLSTLAVSKEAEKIANALGKTPAYRQAVLDETKRMNGKVLTSVNSVMLTELNPDGLEHGAILVPNAGLDQSNIKEGYAIGWPADPVASVKNLRSQLCTSSGKNIAVILTDSGLCPRRIGVMAFALTVSGIDPFQSLIGTPDLFENEMHVTQEAVADQLATAANFLMGNSNQANPGVVIRDHGLKLCDYEGWVSGIEREKDIYHGVI